MRGPIPKLGFLARNMGPQADAETLVGVAEAAEAAGLDDLWVVDHIAIPPDDAEGSQGRYLDPLATLAFLAARTERIGLGTAVLILPYRPPLPTAKWIASVQELSQGRLRLGIGAGWMEPEFRALGVPRRERGARTDAMLAFLSECFASDRVEAHGQEFLFRPRPKRPPIYIGGGTPRALERALRWGEGWMPMARDPEALREPIETLRTRAAETGRPPLEIVALCTLPLDDPGRARARAAAFGAVGADRLIHGERYADLDAARSRIDALGALGNRSA